MAEVRNGEGETEGQLIKAQGEVWSQVCLLFIFIHSFIQQTSVKDLGHRGEEGKSPASL